MRFSNKNLRLLLAALVLIGVGSLISYAIFHKSPSSRSTSNPGSITINDSSAGLSFNMSKNFPAIPKNALALFNSNALYGFQATNDKNAQCVITQTESGNITAGELRDGVFNEIKNNHANASLDSSAVVQVGAVRGVSLQTSFTDSGLHIKRIEIAAVGNTKLTFAYCQSLATDSSKYYNDFTIFFSSLKLTK